MQAKGALLVLAAVLLVLVALAEAGPCSEVKETSDYDGDSYLCKMCCKDAGYKLSFMGSKCSCLLKWGKPRIS